MKDKRKVFNDAIDFLTADAPKGGVSMVSVDAITPFRDHPFKLYKGDRLNDMVESIKEHGILIPVIVRKLGSDMKCLQVTTDIMLLSLLDLQRFLLLLRKI